MDKVKLMLEESVKFELEAYKIYGIFKESNKTDSEFWGIIAEEELDHASLLKKCISLHSDNTEILDIISTVDIEIIADARKNAERYITEFQNNPTPQKAWELAIKIENSIVESAYQKFMDSMPDSKLRELFQLLNGREQSRGI